MATRLVARAVPAWDLVWAPTAMVAHLTVWEAAQVATVATAVDIKYTCCFKFCPIKHTTLFYHLVIQQHFLINSWNSLVHHSASVP